VRHVYEFWGFRDGFHVTHLFTFLQLTLSLEYAFPHTMTVPDLHGESSATSFIVHATSCRQSGREVYSYFTAAKAGRYLTCEYRKVFQETKAHVKPLLSERLR
jgi:hypothetical protein